MKKCFFVGLLLVAAAGCGTIAAVEYGDDRPMTNPPPSRMAAVSSGTISTDDAAVLDPRKGVPAARKPATETYLHKVGKVVVIIRDTVGLGLEPRWESFDLLLARVFGEKKLDRPRTIEFCWVNNPRQDSLVAFLLRDKRDRYVRVSVQVSHLNGKTPEECRDLIQSSFLYAFAALESGSKQYANLRALTEPRLAYVFDTPGKGRKMPSPLPPPISSPPSPPLPTGVGRPTIGSF